MARSKSNTRKPVQLDVILLAACQDGRQPSLSITTVGFPTGDSILLEGKDQQLVDLEAVLSEYLALPETIPGEKLTVAAFFDRMAALLRAKAAEHEQEQGSD